MRQSAQGPPCQSGGPPGGGSLLRQAAATAAYTPQISSSKASTNSISSTTGYAASSAITTPNSSSSSSSSSISGLLGKVIVGVRFRPLQRFGVSPPSRSSIPGGPPSGGSSGEAGDPSSSTSSVAGPLEGPTEGGIPSRGGPRRPPWARRGPSDEDWSFREGEETEGWILAAPWALDLGGPPRVGPLPEIGAPGGVVRAPSGPQRIWDGYKDICYEADYVFGPNATNAEVYIHLVKHLVSAAIKGRNAAVLAYGQTAAGKTHTMFGGPLRMPSSRGGAPQQRGGLQGAPHEQPNQGPQGAPEKGIVELALRDLFREREETKGDTEAFSVSIAMLEVYQETVTDLLLGGPQGPPGGGPTQTGGAPHDGRQKRTIALCDRSDGKSKP